MKHYAHVIFLFITGAVITMAFIVEPARANADSATSSSAQTITMEKIAHRVARQEIARAFILRDWGNLKGHIRRYTGPQAERLFTLSTLDAHTARGNKKAQVRFISYEDYECPFCKRFALDSASTLYDRYKDQVQFIYRFKPLETHGETAKEEAKAGACMARALGAPAFWRYTDTVYRATGSNGKGTGQSISSLVEPILSDTGSIYALKLFKSCMSGPLPEDAKRQAGFKGVAGTPTIFIINVENKTAWMIAGALPTWVFEAALANVLAGRAANDQKGALDVRAAGGH